MNLALALGHKFDDPDEKKKIKEQARLAAIANGEIEEGEDIKEYTMEELLAPVNYLTKSKFGTRAMSRVIAERD